MKSEFNRIKKIKNSHESIDEYKELLENEDAAVQQAVLSNSNFTENMQIALATDISTPVKIMIALSKSYYVVVRNCLAANEKCPTELIEMFVKKEDALMGVSSNPNTPNNLLETIFYIGKEIYKEFLSANIATPTKILEELSIDEDVYIRVNIAANIATPENVLTVLAMDISMEVRSKVAGNNITPDYVLEELLKDHSYVSDIAKATLENKKSDQEKMLNLKKSLDNDTTVSDINNELFYL